MKTVEERAIALMNTLPCEETKGLVYNAYKLGALEQHKIDVEKALYFLRCYDECDFSCWEEYEANFRKAMNEYENH